MHDYLLDITAIPLSADWNHQSYEGGWHHQPLWFRHGMTSLLSHWHGVWLESTLSEQRAWCSVPKKTRQWSYQCHSRASGNPGSTDSADMQVEVI